MSRKFALAAIMLAVACGDAPAEPASTTPPAAPEASPPPADPLAPARGFLSAPPAEAVAMVRWEAQGQLEVMTALTKLAAGGPVTAAELDNVRESLASVDTKHYTVDAPSAFRLHWPPAHACTVARDPNPDLPAFDAALVAGLPADARAALDRLEGAVHVVAECGDSRYTFSVTDKGDVLRLGKGLTAKGQAEADLLRERVRAMGYHNDPNERPEAEPAPR